MRFPVVALLIALLVAACSPPNEEQGSIRIVRQDDRSITLRGLADATAPVNTEKFDRIAATHCQGTGQVAKLDTMKQVKTFTFELRYLCVAAG